MRLIFGPCSIKMWDMYETKEGVFIVTDLCRGGELFDRLVEKVHYNELDARHIMKQVISGVEYLHSHDIIHRDLKPENILLRDKSEHSDVSAYAFGAHLASISESLNFCCIRARFASGCHFRLWLVALHP